MEEVKKEKARADEAAQAVSIVNKSIELAKMTEEAFKKALAGINQDKLDLQAKVGILEAEVQMLKDLRVKDQADIAKQIDDANKVAIDNAWYHL